MRTFFTSALALSTTLSLAAATIDVQVVNQNGSPVTDAVVYAVPDTRVPVGHKVAYMDQKNRMFVPHVLPIQTGTWVEFPNSDDIRHQVFSLSKAKRFQLPLYQGKPSFPLQFGEPGVVVLGCNIHEWMSAYIVVVDTPYFAKTEAGKATLRDVVPGRYTVRLWYPEMRSETKAEIVTVTADDHPSVSFKTMK
jgi:plastocyanin